jgi:hypothetical protein
MDDQLMEVFVPIRQSEQHTVDRLHLTEWSKHSATDNVYAELKQIVNCMEIHVTPGEVQDSKICDTRG